MSVSHVFDCESGLDPFEEEYLRLEALEELKGYDFKTREGAMDAISLLEADGSIKAHFVIIKMLAGFDKPATSPVFDDDVFFKGLEVLQGAKRGSLYLSLLLSRQTFGFDWKEKFGEALPEGARSHQKAVISAIMNEEGCEQTKRSVYDRYPDIVGDVLADRRVAKETLAADLS